MIIDDDFLSQIPEGFSLDTVENISGGVELYEFTFIEEINEKMYSTTIQFSKRTICELTKNRILQILSQQKEAYLSTLNELYNSTKIIKAYI